MKLDLRHLIAGGVAILLAVAATLVFKLSHRGAGAPAPAAQAWAPPVACAKADFPRETVAMGDEAMEGVFKKGQSITVQRGWYRCHPVERGDIVLFRFSNTIDPVVRRVSAAPGDRFRLEREPSKGAWTLQINGEPLKKRNGERFVFGSSADPLLSLYERAHPEGLGPGDAIVFAEAPNARGDSGELGVVNASDFLGKVEN